ncbi:MAG: gliding motility-associated C-terminal domain-containing protein [Bacteroidetes bacterium]|nr:gliding motility-associated C-terminal domain-containing protein [Bacteroidota bacterium]
MFILFFANSLYAQNLVPNGNFEDYYNCIRVVDGPYYPVFNSLKNWITPTMASPDYDNKCYPDADSLCHVPQNIFGYQFPKSGDGYIDIDCFSLNPLNYREYIEVELLSSLLQDKKYCIKFYISLSDSSDLATDDIGVYFSDTLIYSPTISHLPFTPQIINLQGNYLADKVNWVLMSWEYIAKGGEKYITIGNFFDDDNTNIIHVTGGSNSYIKEAIYYIDDVSVTLIEDSLPPAKSDNIFIPDAFSPNGDLENDILYVYSNNIKEMDFCIYNRWGERVFESREVNKGWDGRYKNELCHTGVFVYWLRAMLKDGKEVVKKGNVTLVR